MTTADVERLRAALEAVDSEIVLTGQLKELVDAALEKVVPQFGVLRTREKWEFQKMTEMTLLEELLSERDYWLVPSSPTGKSDHPEFTIMKVKKGVNVLAVEDYCRWLEQQMLEILRKPQ